MGHQDAESGASFAVSILVCASGPDQSIIVEKYSRQARLNTLRFLAGCLRLWQRCHGSEKATLYVPGGRQESGATHFGGIRSPEVICLHVTCTSTKCGGITSKRLPELNCCCSGFSVQFRRNSVSERTYVLVHA